MANPKEDQGERLTERIVVLVKPKFKAKYDAYCAAIGENQSEHIRSAWEGELALYEAAKA